MNSPGAPVPAFETYLSMYPVTAFTFVTVKLFVVDFNASRMTSICQIFFYSWLLLIVLFSAKRDNYFTNKYTLLLGAALGVLVPVVNGIMSGNWLWKTLSERHYDIFFIDAFWLVLSIITFIIATGLKRKDVENPRLRPASIRNIDLSQKEYTESGV